MNGIQKRVTRKDAGLPDKNRRDPHKPGESPALQRKDSGSARRIVVLEAIRAGGEEFEEIEVAEDLELLADLAAQPKIAVPLKRVPS